MRLLITPKALELTSNPETALQTQEALKEAMRYALGLETDAHRERGKFTWYTKMCPLAVHYRLEDDTALVFTRSHQGAPALYDEYYKLLLETAVEMPVA